jgi:hypothetical protein
MRRAGIRVVVRVVRISSWGWLAPTGFTRRVHFAASVVSPLMSRNGSSFLNVL